MKESSLSVDRRDPSKGSIVPPECLEDFHYAQLLLRSTRKQTVFRCLHGALPCTIYAYRILNVAGFGDFDLTTHFGGQSIAVRVGNLGMIFVNDGGLQMHAGDKGPMALDGLELQPLQFSEVAARAHYKASLRDATHQYTSWDNPTLLTVEQVSVSPFGQTRLPSGEMQISRPWQNAECAKLMERYCGWQIKDIYDKKDGVLSTILVDSDENLFSPKQLLRFTSTGVSTGVGY